MLDSVGMSGGKISFQAQPDKIGRAADRTVHRVKDRSDAWGQLAVLCEPTKMALSRIGGW